MGVGGTPDNAFVVKLVIEKYRSLKKPVYAAFIDFRKAYDAVNRPLSWELVALAREQMVFISRALVF